MSPTHLAIDWHQIFVPSGSLLELVVRGSLMYLLILTGFRIFRRDAGSLSVSDLLVVVLIADAAQNGMAGEYKSLTEGVVIVATIFAWNYVLDWLAYRSRFVYWLLHPPSLLLIQDGKVDLVINTPYGRGARSDGYFIRTASASARIPCITTLPGVLAAIRGIEALRGPGSEPLSLQDYHREGEQLARDDARGRNAGTTTGSRRT